ncbi:hypothetical protein [Phycicoccus sonneratiae]|uniref:WXG100 family type VII secretion target n=1 Tax=Phycicoccus sonneratiae TaxID=2807628 RepID=A0ABS2CNZ4_9MICO|nr:hypothetical protein [Phycicoccus sonneraticus]MBM6401601.1 hypothetical protein [Phycicoccus sonneraticus]
MIDTDLPGSFASLQAASTWLADLADAMDGAGDDAVAARSAAAADWDGASHAAYTAHVSEVIAAGDARVGVVRRCAQAVDTYAWELQACQAEMAAHRARAAAGGLAVVGTTIEAPPAAFDPGPPLLMATPAQQRQFDEDRGAFTARLEQNELYEQLRIDVRATYDRLDTCVTATLAPAQEEAASDSGLKALLEKAKTAADRIGDSISFGDAAFTVRERDLRKAATSAATALAASRSGNPAVRAGSKAPSARGLANAAKTGTKAANLAEEAAAAAKWGKVLKGGGPVTGLVGAGVSVAGGESPGRAASGFAGGMIGGAAAGAAVVGGAALLGVSAPVIVVGGAAVVVGIAAAKGGEWLWDNVVPDGAKEAIDNAAHEAWDWTTDKASDAWDSTTDTVSDAWNSVFG